MKMADTEGGLLELHKVIVYYTISDIYSAMKGHSLYTLLYLVICFG